MNHLFLIALPALCATLPMVAASTTAPKMDTASFNRAKAFLQTSSPLERALFAFEFEHGSAEAVVTAVVARQNEDGGFRDFDPDFGSPLSSVLSTVKALHVLADCGIDPTHPAVRHALTYLQATFDPRYESWAILPAHDNTSPHSPWWHYSEKFPEQWARFQDNPRPDVLACLYLFPDSTTAALRERVEQKVLERLRTLTTAPTMDGMECYAALADTPGISPALTKALHEKLPAWIDQRVEREPANWAKYNLRPLNIANRPDSPWRPQLDSAVQANLDYVLAQQNADGSFSPYWSWGPLFPEAWPEAKRRWQGILTLQMLHVLHAYGRIADLPVPHPTASK